MQKFKIKIIGLGGSGANIVNYCIKKKVKVSEMVIIDTDKSYFDKLSKSVNKILIGKEFTKGVGTSGKYDLGLLSAHSSLNEIKKSITGSEVIIITAGLGGGTASGALQIIASAAKKLNIFLIGIFSKPLEWEGKKKSCNANQSIEMSSNHFNILFTIPCDKIYKTKSEPTNLWDTFTFVNEYLIKIINEFLSFINKSKSIIIK